MTWGELTDAIYALYESGEPECEMIFVYETVFGGTVINDVSGEPLFADITEFEIDHQMRRVILK
jgi:hypothetical protein